MKIRLSPERIGLGILAALISLAITFSAYLYFIQTPAVSKRELIFAVILWVVLCPVNYLVVGHFLLPRFRLQPRWLSSLLLLISALCGYVLVLVAKPPTPIRLLETHTLVISIPASSGGEIAGREITLNWFTTSLGDVGFKQFQLEGNWQTSGKGMLFQGPGAGALRWMGKTGSLAELFFTGDSRLEDVVIRWDGTTHESKIPSPSKGLVPIRQSFTTPPSQQVPGVLATWFTCFYVLLIFNTYLIFSHFLNTRSMIQPTKEGLPGSGSGLEEPSPSRSAETPIRVGEDFGWRGAILLGITSMISVLPLAAHAALGTHMRLIADDFCSAAIVNSVGVVRAVGYWYLTWSGRFAASFLDAITGRFGLNATRISTLSVVIVWLVALLWLLTRIIRFSGRFTRLLASLTAAAVILAATLQITPDLGQSLYWGQGMRSVLPPLILATLQLALVITLSRLWDVSRWWVVFLGFLALIGGGFSETFSFVYLLFLLLLFGNILRFGDPGKKRVWVLLISACIAGTFAGLLIMALAPGNQIRQAQLAQQGNLIAVIRISLTAMVGFLGKIISQEINLLNCVLVFVTGFLLSALILPAFRKSDNTLSVFPRSLAIHVPLYTFLLIYFCFIPAALTLSQAPPGRTEIIPAYILVLGCGGWGFTLGWLAELRLSRESNAVATSRDLKSPPNAFSGITGVLVALWMVLLVTNSLYLTSGAFSRLDAFRTFARDWDRQDSAILTARSEDRTSFTIQPVPNPLGMVSGPSGGWVNDCMNQYYGLDLFFSQ